MTVRITKPAINVREKLTELSVTPQNSKLYFGEDLKLNTIDSGVNVTGEVIVNTLTPSTDSALASKAYVDANAGSGGTSSSSTIALNLLDSTGRAGTILSSSLRTGDPVYFDYDANVWTGAYTDSDHVASHVIVEYSTINSNFKIAQTGVFNLESDGNPVNTLSPHFWYHLPTTSGAFPSTSVDSAVGQVLYYALDADTIDLNIGEPRLTSADAGSQSVSSSTTSSSFSIPISMLTTGLGVGDPIYYDSDVFKWVGASDSADGVASHVIVKYSTLNSTFDIAQSGIHILDSDGASPSFDTNSYYFLGDSIGVPTTIQPINGIYQSLYYALDSDTIDVNIGEAQDISPSNPNEARITTISVTSTPYVIPFASGGKMFVLNTGSASCTFNSANFLTGDRLSVYNNTNFTRTLTFDTYSDGVRIPGSATNYSGSSLTLAAYGLAEVTAITDNGLIVTGGVS